MDEAGWVGFRCPKANGCYDCGHRMGAARFPDGGAMYTDNEPGTASKDTAAVMTPPMSKADYETLAGFRYALRLFLRFSEEEAYRDNLTPQQHQLLLAIQGFPGRDYATIGELAERLQLRQHSVVGLVNRLAHAGLAVREPDLKDRRKV